MIRDSALRGYLLEESLAWLLRGSAYDLLVSWEQDQVRFVEHLRQRPTGSASTVLYFETDTGDGFREPGFSKERQLEPHHQRLLTDTVGFLLIRRVRRQHCRDLGDLAALSHRTGPARRVAAHLPRYKGTSRTHTDADLRTFLAWCSTHGLDPLRDYITSAMTPTR